MTIRLLLVDDHRMMREGLRSLLEAHAEFQVVGEASDGRDSVALTRSLHPDVVVMDVGMKELNGIEATRQLRSEAPDIKVIILSTHSHEHYVLGALEAGASAYVLKMGAHEELVTAIRAAMRGRRFLSPDITGIVVDACIQGTMFSRDAPHPTLTGREREILQLVAEGRTSGEVAQRLNISTRTVEQHRRRTMQKLNRHSVAELTHYAIREGIVGLGD